MAHPLSVSIETFDTGKVDDDVILNLINKHFDLRPGAIIRYFDLRRPIYRQTPPTATSAAPTSTCPGRRRTRLLNRLKQVSESRDISEMMLSEDQIRYRRLARRHRRGLHL